MGDHRYLVQQFNSQENARWKNKIENNRLANEIAGKGGIEYERAFHLKSVELEKRRIQEELDAIRSHGRRRGVQRHSKPNIITTSLNPPLNKPELSERDRRPPAGSLGRRATITGHYDIPSNQRVVVRNESKASPVPVQKTAKDYTQAQVNVGTGIPAHVGQTPKSEPIYIKFDPGENKSPVILPTEGVRESPLRNPTVYHRRHMVEFVDEDRLTHNKGRKISKFGSGTVSSYPSNSAEKDSDKWNKQYASISTGTKSANISPLKEANVNAARENIARRLTDQVQQGEPTKAQGDVARTDQPENRQSEATGKPDERDDMATNVLSDKAKRVDQDAGNTKNRRGSKSDSVSEMLKGSKFDADKYNPDGSLRTKHQVPSFDQSYEQARKARYIRSKERSELDRELSINEVFDKAEDSDKHSQTGSA